MNLRRLLGLTSALLLAFALTAAPAKANPHGRVCTNRHTGNQYKTVCVEQNTQAPFQERVEGLGDYFADPYPGGNYNIQIDYIKLWHCGSGVCDLAKIFNPADSWFGVPGTHDQSTAWWDLCRDGDWGNFHTDFRFRLQWLDQPGDPIGPWVLLQSNDSVEHC